MLVPILIAVPYSLQIFTSGVNFAGYAQLGFIDKIGVKSISSNFSCRHNSPIDTNFFTRGGSRAGKLGSVWSEMNVCDEWNNCSPGAKLFFDLGEDSAPP